MVSLLTLARFRNFAAISITGVVLLVGALFLDALLFMLMYNYGVVDGVLKGKGYHKLDYWHAFVVMLLTHTAKFNANLNYMPHIDTKK